MRTTSQTLANGIKTSKLDTKNPTYIRLTHGNRNEISNPFKRLEPLMRAIDTMRLLTIPNKKYFAIHKNGCIQCYWRVTGIENNFKIMYCDNN